MNQQGTENLTPPTTKDLAKAAGVSRATVDRVLNGRTKVKQKTVDRINQAIKDLGFVRNQAAANLAKRKVYRFLFVLPESGDLFLGELRDKIDEAVAAFASDMIWAEVETVDENDPHKVAAFLSSLTRDRFDGIAIMAPETPQLRDAGLRLIERDIAVLPFVSNLDIEGCSDWVGIDNVAAGATAATLLGRFSRVDSGSVLLISDTMQSRDSLERRFGFDNVINQEFSHLTPLPSLETYGSQERATKIIRKTLLNNPEISGVYVMSSEARLPLEILSEAYENVTRPIIIAHERTTFTEQALKAGSIDAIITQDPGHLVRSAIRKLRAHVDRRETLASQERIRIEIVMKQNL